MNQHSATYWLPRIAPVGLPIPESVIYHIQSTDNINLDTIKNISDKLGYPVFIRTDLRAAGYIGPRGYKITSERYIKSVVSISINNTLARQEVPTALILRKFLDLDGEYATDKGQLIVNEWRVFVKQGKSVCIHFLWPSSYIKLTEWREGLRTWHSHAISEPPNSDMIGVAERAAKAANKDLVWGVDLARDKTGKWWVIDLNLASDINTWHPTHGN